ncbi:DNA mismatch repair endonuclease MutL [Buchnera aphidicola (Aphis fabae)]|uniref:DNA mismatch repair protein MutL n=1 Tax=Buchnera aphidicola (Aphis fabae) TaxID=571430 RepID=A0A5J6ZD75_9GAMM|nr:DNA mismatch repair endonuclease MutL [Buchnera aphidicola]QFQ32718.1 DNA mismatch repair endonuclease MutL [Buchnera aphidicola (Aphis fabae)]
MPIRILPISVSSQIAAGEIIERPASVIKELLENSIDAKSQNIDINIEEHGFKSITIKDDGYGINKNELLLAISPYATSKIFTFSDLTTINTFGFRGEALSSIRSVSRMTLISCYKYNNIGWKIYTEGFNQKIILLPIAHPIGTSVIVENLFYNIPVRLKFLNNKKSEFLKIYDVIKKIALSHFNLNILFKKNKNLVVNYNKIKSFDDRIFRLQQVFDKLDINSLLTVKQEIGNLKLFGWIVYPSYFLNSFKNIQYCYINNRFVHNSVISNAVLNAYYEITGVKINRSFILYIHIPSSEIDINIHPTKNQVRFNKSNEIYILIYNTIINILKKNKIQSFTHNFSLAKKEQCFIKDFYTFYFQLIKQNSLEKQKKLFFKNLTNNIPHIYSKKQIKNEFFYSVKLLIIVKKYYGLIYYLNNFILISFPLAKKIVNQHKLQHYIKNNIIPKSYLFNFEFLINSIQYKILFSNQLILYKFGFSFILLEKYINLTKIPYILKQQNTNLLISNFFSFIFSNNELNIKKILQWFNSNILIYKKSWSYLDGILLLLEIEYFCPLILKKPPLQLLHKINIDEALCVLKI